MDKTVDFLGVRVGSLNKTEMVNRVLEFTEKGRDKFITYFNAHCVNMSFTDVTYKEILKNADLVYTGGQGVVWASKFLGTPLPERVNILDFFDILAKELKNRAITIYLLGGEEDAVNRAKETLKKKGLNVVGSRHGFFDKKEERGIIEECNNLRPNILMVGMGVPKQEKWVSKHLRELDVNLCWAVGGVFDLFAGRLKRAPRWVSNCGLEWLYLGLQRPKRLFNRYLFGNFIFLYHVLRHKLKK